MGLILAPLLSSIGLEKPPTSTDRFMFFMGKPLVFISYLITVVWFGAALGEELLMRGFLLNKLSKMFQSTKFGLVIAIMLHAFLFGSLHIYQGIAGVIMTSVVGAILACVYFYAKKKLFPVILAHIIINTLSLTVLYIKDGVIN